ncbi:10540_t:CDS:2, partial [Racocetra persica]
FETIKKRTVRTFRFGRINGIPELTNKKESREFSKKVKGNYWRTTTCW